MAASPSEVPRWNLTVIPDRVKERAHTKWALDVDCWISTYSTASHGYAQIGWTSGRKNYGVLAHRASWEYVNGPVPQGKTLDHLCKSRRCVNPAHLRVLDNYENARRTCGRDWPLGQCINGHSNDHLEKFADGRTHCGICVRSIWKTRPRGAGNPPRPRKVSAPKPPTAPRTHCRNGHEKTPENSYIRPSGTRECLPCKASHARIWHGTNRPNGKDPQ